MFTNVSDSLKKFGPIALIGATAALAAMTPELIAAYPASAGVVGMVAMFLNWLAPTPTTRSK